MSDRVRNILMTWFTQWVRESPLPLTARFRPHTLKDVKSRRGKRKDDITSKAHYPKGERGVAVKWDSTSLVIT